MTPLFADQLLTGATVPKGECDGAVGGDVGVVDEGVS